MTVEEMTVIAEAFRAATSLAWASESPLVGEMADLLADKLKEAEIEGFDKDVFLAIAKGRPNGNNFWTISWTEPNGNTDERMIMVPTIGSALAWLLDLRPYMAAHLSEVKVVPYKALARKGRGYNGFL